MLYNDINLSVCKIASKEKFRHELCSVLFCKNKTVAPENIKAEDFPTTDGQSVLTDCVPFMVNAKSISEIKLPKSKTLPILNNLAIKKMNDKSVEFLTTDLEKAEIKTLQKIEGNFPDAGKLWPFQKPVAEIKVNGAYLKNLVDILMKLGGSMNEITLKFYGNEKPLLIEAGKLNQRGRGLIVPIRE